MSHVKFSDKMCDNYKYTENIRRDKIANVDLRSVRDGEANFVSQIYGLLREEASDLELKFTTDYLF